MKKILKTSLALGSIILGLLIVGILLMIWLSPFGNHKEENYKLLKESIIIDVPVDQVYTYLGNSNNATDWSVFVDHITSLNSDQIKDGEQGSIRRCFVNQDESGEKWDEKVLLIEKNKRRRLSCYNYKEFKLTAGTLQTEQIYQQTRDGKCLLSFTLFFPPGQSSFLKRMKMYYASYEVADIFERNLNNIKRLNER